MNKNIYYRTKYNLINMSVKPPNLDYSIIDNPHEFVRLYVFYMFCLSIAVLSKL